MVSIEVVGDEEGARLAGVKIRIISTAKVSPFRVLVESHQVIDVLLFPHDFSAMYRHAQEYPFHVHLQASSHVLYTLDRAVNWIL